MVKAVMNYTIEDMKAFSRKAHNNFLFILYCIILLSFSGFYMLVIAIAIANGTSFSNLALPLFLLAVGSSVIIYNMINRYVISPKNNLKNIKSKYGDNPVHFDFEEKYFTVNVEKGVNSENISIEYDKLIKAKEVKDYFFLYSDKQHAYIIKKSAFVMGCPEDLSVYLKKQLGKKFIIRL
ncbi:MAG: YcxB family protein [Oscillospiraceae bacterium]|nr:YcxB family protein [Oscillospiraceae bacterium]